MGATMCCADRSVKAEEALYEPLKIKYDMQKIFGIDNYRELEETECDAKYKNKYEMESNLPLIKLSLTDKFRKDRKMFPTFDKELENQKSVVVEKAKNNTILCRGYFPNQACDIDFFLRSSFDL